MAARSAQAASPPQTAVFRSAALGEAPPEIGGTKASAWMEQAGEIVLDRTPVEPRRTRARDYCHQAEQLREPATNSQSSTRALYEVCSCSRIRLADCHSAIGNWSRPLLLPDS